MDNLQNFHYAMFLAKNLYNVVEIPEDFEDIGLIAYNMIGNKQVRLYKTTLSPDCSNNTITLPCNCDRIEAVTYGFEDWNYVSNIYPNGDYNSMFTESYIEGRKAFRNPLYISGKYVKYERVGDTLYLNKNYKGPINILYWGQILDDEGLPYLTDKEALAIATFVAYSSKYKEALSTNNSGIFQLAQTLELKWNRLCDAARVADYFTQNDMDEILDAKTSWDRKVHNKTYKPLQ